MQLVSQTPLTTGFLKVKRNTYEGGVVREVAETGDAVVVLPYDTERQIVVLVRQFRAPANGAITEAVAGMIDKGETPEAAAVRETYEETGIKLDASNLVRVSPPAGVYASPGILDQRKHLYLCPFSESDRTGTGGGLASEHEDIEIVETDMRQFLSGIGSDIIDAKTMILAYAFATMVDMP